MRDTAYAFAQAVDRQIEALSDRDYHLRVGGSQRLREELLPLSRLGLHFALPGMGVDVEAFEDDGPVDGHIRLSGFRSQEFDVEVTYLRSYQDSLRGELLHSEGVAPGAGPIARDKATGKVVAEFGSRDHDQYLAELGSSLYDLYAKKVAKPYPKGTMLLVAFEDSTVYGFSDWRKLFASLTSRGDLPAGPFGGICFLNCITNELQTAV